MINFQPSDRPETEIMCTISSYKSIYHNSVYTQVTQSYIMSFCVLRLNLFCFKVLVILSHKLFCCLGQTFLVLKLQQGKRTWYWAKILGLALFCCSAQCGAGVHTSYRSHHCHKHNRLFNLGHCNRNTPTHPRKSSSSERTQQQLYTFY